jgi:MFS family permease
MESFCMFLSGNFVALPYFKERYGVEIGLNAAGVMEHAIPTKWQSSLFQAGQCGAFVGVLLAGPVTNRLGYRWTTLLALFMMNATIFITFFVSLETLDARSIMLTFSRPTLLRSSSSDRRSKVSHGASSSQTVPPTPPRSFHWP